MTPEEFNIQLQKKAREVKTYAQTRYPSVAGNVALRFVNGNFRAQGFQGQSFERWQRSKKKSGSTLVDKGHLRAATFYTTQPGQTTLKNSMPYAKTHNEGFKGTITVAAHSRNRYTRSKVGTGKFTKSGKERKQTVTSKSGSSMVKAHRRKMNLPKRQFMPTHPNDSPILNKAIERQVMRDINKLMQ